MEDRFIERCRELIDSGLIVVDVGAAGTFKDLPRLAPLCVLHTFEPRPGATEPSLSFDQVHRHDVALGSTSGVRELFVTATGWGSSTLPPNQRLIDRLASEGGGAIFGPRVVGKTSVSCITLDEFADRHDVRQIDYLKLDTQGTELDIIRGGERIVRSKLVIRTEVEFVEMYEGQDLFDEVARELSLAGFRFLDFTDARATKANASGPMLYSFDLS